MIQIIRSKKAVRILFDTDLPYNEDNEQNATLGFSRECDNVKEAELMRRYLIERFNTAVKQIRKHAYDQGWKDAKAKKGRHATEFYNSFDPNEIYPGW